jgi:predicted small lipoprotein YifL
MKRSLLTTQLICVLALAGCGQSSQQAQRAN